MLGDHLEIFLEQIGQAADFDSVKSMLGNELQRRGFENFAYVQLRAPRGSRQRVYIGTYPPSWSAHYREMNLHLHDPVHSHAARTIRPFLWSDVRQIRDLPIADKLVFSPAADIGICSGGGVPIHGPQGGVATLQIADSSEAEAFDKRFLQHRFELQLVASCAHEAIVKLTTDVVPFNVELTARQKEILLWAARGKTNQDIGALLGIKTDTVRQHLMRISAILDVCNRAQATAIAVTHHIIDI